MSDPEGGIVEALRGRVLRGLRAGTLDVGDRLASARQLATEFQADHRVILSAYRQLADEGLVDIRERGGVYVAEGLQGDGAKGDADGARTVPLPVSFFVDTLAEGFAREISAADLLEWLRRATETLRLRAVVLAGTIDQASALARELRDDFGVLADALVAPAPEHADTAHALLRSADLLLCTSDVQLAAQALAAPFGIATITLDLRADLAAGEWAMMLRQPVWVVVATTQFGDMLRLLLAGVKGIENLHIVVNGRDDLSIIPEHAHTYVTHRVRETINDTTFNGRLLPTVRAISVKSARQIYDVIVRMNLRATLAARVPLGSTPGEQP